MVQSVPRPDRELQAPEHARDRDEPADESEVEGERRRSKRRREEQHVRPVPQFPEPGQRASLRQRSVPIVRTSSMQLDARRFQITFSAERKSYACFATKMHVH